MSYGIAGGDICNVVAMITDRSAEGREYDGPWVTECSEQELRDSYKGWEPEVDVLLQVSRFFLQTGSQEILKNTQIL